MNQREKILEYIDEHGSITSLTAMRSLGIMRLASRINEIRESGVDIVSVYVSTQTRYDEPTHYVRYMRKERAIKEGWIKDGKQDTEGIV